MIPRFTLDESVDERGFSKPAQDPSEANIAVRREYSSGLSDGKSQLSTQAKIQSEDDKAGIPVGSLRDLMDRIVTNHHAHARHELSRLRVLAREVSHVYGPSHLELMRVAALIADLDTEMKVHTTREENGLFQCIARMENAMERGIPLSHATIENLAGPVKCIMQERDTIAEMMGKLHSITGGFHAPGDASTKLKELYSSLADLECVLQQHMFMERKTLFPRALDLEAHLR